MIRLLLKQNLVIRLLLKQILKLQVCHLKRQFCIRLLLRLLKFQIRLETFF